ncbi:hypothetical protein BDM02DRAFT_1514285 [Thelephora ganbajun]|uniref:Uncharacterized protein n=1 Tax=Thelephora ganbajun TaxID=370292 RepID=A0ACB6ZLD1_THEGA|nr:hypothetical protein BDM02DRAFT_1514285 [Thelephora ganbajun]
MPPIGVNAKPQHGPKTATVREAARTPISLPWRRENPPRVSSIATGISHPTPPAAGILNRENCFFHSSATSTPSGLACLYRCFTSAGDASLPRSIGFHFNRAGSQWEIESRIGTHHPARDSVAAHNWSGVCKIPRTQTRFTWDNDETPPTRVSVYHRSGPGQGLRYGIRVGLGTAVRSVSCRNRPGYFPYLIGDVDLWFCGLDDSP